MTTCFFGFAKKSYELIVTFLNDGKSRLIIKKIPIGIFRKKKKMQRIIMTVIGFLLNVGSVIAPSFTGRIGLKLSCYPRRPKLSERYTAFLHSAQSFTLDYDGDKVIGYQWGNGSKKILFLHGWQSHTYRWKSYIEELMKDDFTIYAFDAPGHGLSEGSFLTVPRYSEVIEKVISMVGQPDHIVAHSIGSFSTLFTLHRLPHVKPKSVVLLAIPGGAPEFFAVFTRLLNLSERTVQVIRKQFMNMGYREPEYYFAPDFAVKMSVKALLIHDEQDDQTPVSNSKIVHDRWKNSRLTITTGLGHSLKSAQIIRDVLGFIKEDS